MKKLLLTALFLAMGTATTFAQKTTIAKNDNGWQNINETIIDLKSQTQDILITDSDQLKAIKLEVTKSPLLLDSFDVHFANGEKQTINYGGFDPVVLNGNGDNAVTKITLRYKSMNSDDKSALVTFLGLKTNSDKANSKLAAR